MAALSRDVGRTSSAGVADTGFGHGASPLTGRPVVSGRSRARLADWTAPPAVPLVRLSIAATTTTRPARGVDGDLEVDGVRPEGVRGPRPATLGQHVDERLVGVRLDPRGADGAGVGGHARPQPRGAGGEDAAGHRGQRRGERDPNRFARGRHRGSAPSPGCAGGRPPTPYGAHRPHHLAAEQVRLEAAAGTGRAARGDDDDVRLEQPGGETRGERQRHGGRVAARDGDPAGAGQHLALRRAVGVDELGQAVGPGAGVLAAVELRPGRGVGQPVVGAAVDDDDVRRQVGGDADRWPVRQGEEDDVVPGEALGVVGPRTRSASGSRCGWCSPRSEPAFEAAVRAPISVSGWPSSSRSSSPPA